MHVWLLTGREHSVLPAGGGGGVALPAEGSLFVLGNASFI